MLATGAPSAPVLRDIHLPPEPSWWPPAPGWWLVACLLLAALLVAAVAWRRFRRRARARRLVFAEIDACRRRYPDAADSARLAAELHRFLRRGARLHDPRAAQAQGPAWRAVLARVRVDAATLGELGRVEDALYRGDVVLDPARATAAVRQWMRLALRPRRWKRGEAGDA